MANFQWCPPNCCEGVKINTSFLHGHCWKNRILLGNAEVGNPKIMNRKTYIRIKYYRSSLKYAWCNPIVKGCPLTFAMIHMCRKLTSSLWSKSRARLGTLWSLGLEPRSFCRHWAHLKLHSQDFDLLVQLKGLLIFCVCPVFSEIARYGIVCISYLFSVPPS